MAIVIATRVRFEVVGCNKGVQVIRKYFAPNIACIMLALDKAEDLGNVNSYESQI